jgi:hypothetical protein
VKIYKFSPKTHEILCEAFGVHSLSQTAVSEWHSCFKAGQCQIKMMNIQGDQAPAKQQKILKN